MVSFYSCFGSNGRFEKRCGECLGSNKGNHVKDSESRPNGANLKEKMKIIVVQIKHPINPKKKNL